MFLNAKEPSEGTISLSSFLSVFANKYLNVYLKINLRPAQFNYTHQLEMLLMTCTLKTLDAVLVEYAFSVLIILINYIMKRLGNVYW